MYTSLNTAKHEVQDSASQLTILLSEADLSLE